MKIYTRIEFDSSTGEVLTCESFDYDGPIALCTGVEEAAAVGGAASKGAATAAEVGAAGLAAEGVGAGALAAGAGEAAFGDLMIGELATGGVEGVMGAGAGAGAGLTLQNVKDVATVLSPVSSAAQALQGLEASKRMGQLTGLPQVSPSAKMPTLGDLDTMNAMRGNLQQQLQRRGRSATILTAPSGDKLGS